MSEHDIPETPLDIAYGDLNDVNKPNIRKRWNLNSDQTFQAIAAATAESYTPDGLANVGEFKGICLKVVGGTSGLPAQEKGSWLTNFFDDTATAESTDNLKNIEIKVRVPEVHSMLPVPNSIGPDAPIEDHLIMDMYPTFVAQSTAVQEPKPGDLVWVDWGNRQNWTDPYYIRPVQEEAAAAQGSGGANPGGATDAFGRPCAGTYSAQPPSGDAIAGTNVSIKPFAGLPRLKRAPAPKGQAVQFNLESPNRHDATLIDATLLPGGAVDPISAKWWEKERGPLPPGKSFLVPFKSNGPRDKKHAYGRRSTLIWYAHTTDFSQPWELIYWFHGLMGFSQKNFRIRFVPQCAKLVAEGRNFVFVQPELPWSKRGTGKQQGPRQSGAWRKDVADTWGGDFARFHKEVLQLLNDQEVPEGETRIGPYRFKLPAPSFISCYGHSNGGSAHARAAHEGAFNEVKPNRIFFSDSDYAWGTYRKLGYPTAVDSVWENYAKANPNVWITMLTINNHSPRKNAEKFLKAHASEIRGRPIYHIPVSKSHGWCGKTALTIVADEHHKRFEAKDSKAAALPDQGAPNDEEGEENKAAEQQAKEAQEAKEGKPKEAPKEPPKVDKSGEDPPMQKPETAPSQNSKQSDTLKNPTWKTAPAVVYEENRVKTKDYGGSLVGSAAKKLLEEVEPGVKLHKLVASRYRAMKKAAIAAGFTNFKVSSGWRRHRWKSFEQYKEVMIREYGSVRAGRKKKAYNSPHELGLAMDIKTGPPGGLFASQSGSKHISEQKDTALFKWMKENAHSYGFTPYKWEKGGEPWHWECRLPYDAYASGIEFTEDFAVRVTDIGKKTAQLPGGPSTGGPVSYSAATGGSCVRTNGGTASGGSVGGVTPGPYTPGKPYVVSGGGGLGKKLKGGPPAPGAEFWGNPNKNCKELTLFVLHETAGWPNSYKTTYSRLKNKRDKKTKNGGIWPGHQQVVHFWGTVEGDIIQLCPPEQLAPHANSANSWSCGLEVCGFANGRGDSYAPWQKKIAMGIHQVTHNGKGDIHAEPGKVVASGVTSGAQQLSTPQQCESAWQLVLWLSKSPPPAKAGSTIKIPLSFPCGIEGDKFWWSKWNGGPTRDKHSSDAWFKKHRPAGITSHARIHDHHDGMPLEYYCLARAKNLSPNDAYYAMVGALCSGTKVSGKGSWTPLPNAAMVALGKKKFKAAWFTQKTQKWVGQKKWSELAAANPSWFADAKYASLAGTKGYT